MTQTQLTSRPEIDIQSIRVPPVDVSDKHLIQQVLLGDSNAYGQIMRRYNQRLYRVARCIVKNDADALDVVQEAHIKAYTQINTYRGKSQFSSWLAVITRNEALMYLRKNRKEVTMPENEAEIIDISRGMDSAGKSNHGPESIFANKEIRALINENVDHLPADFRAVFVLRAVEQFSVQETADLLDIKPETVKTRLFRAKRLLRTQIQSSLEKMGLQVYEVGGIHCDEIIQNVMLRIQQLESKSGHS